MATTPKLRREYKGAAAASTLNGAFNEGATSVSVTAATGWPTAGPFYAVVDPNTATEEKILVGVITGTALSSITRGVDGTGDVDHSDGAEIYPVFTSIDADEANQLTATYANQGGLVYLGDPSFTQLTIGTAGQVLKVNSGATAPEWGQIPTVGIANDAVTSEKIATSVAGNGLGGGGGSALSVNVDDSTIEINADTLRVKDAGVVTAKIADDAVTSAKIAAPTLTAKTDTFTLALVDENCTIQCNKATAMDAEVPGSGVAFTNGAVVTLMQYGAGQVTVAPASGSGVTVRSSNGLKLRTQYSMATLVKISDTEWVLSGDTVV
jgi:hypothetical protein